MQKLASLMRLRTTLIHTYTIINPLFNPINAVQNANNGVADVYNDVTDVYNGLWNAIISILLLFYKFREEKPQKNLKDNAFQVLYFCVILNTIPF